ncbi:tetratricopeptide repeat protein [Leptospira johnsonii]|uniref:Tetratricopeptide repeat protein n=2 Tax=Leptospira johnsonii TaxID=1917820 RepID=A0A2P2D0V4_9LEPT|nr:tetratricopeptide repeat protein [Leptospira johnsonii]
MENEWIKEGNILLESKQFEEAELLANSILGSDPSNSKAEFILTQAWIGMGKEERKKGNFQKAKEYLGKAYEKWPLNENIRKELAELENSHLQFKKSPMPLRNNSLIQNVYNKSTEDLTLSVNLLRLEIEKLKTELETERKEHTKEKSWAWAYLLLGIQIVVLFGIFSKISKL